MGGLNTPYRYHRYEFADGDRHSLDMNEDIVSITPHPDDPDKILVWTRTRIHDPLEDSDSDAGSGFDTYPP